MCRNYDTSYHFYGRFLYNTAILLLKCVILQRHRSIIRTVAAVKNGTLQRLNKRGKPHWAFYRGAHLAIGIIFATLI